MKKWLLRTVVALAVVFALIQLVPVDRTNPPETKPIQASPEVLAVVQRSCFDCHSNQTHWPWYAYVAPVSWLVADDVHEGRRKLNFSTWGDYAATKRLSLSSTVMEQVEAGQMPLPKYLPMHPDAKLSPADVAVLRRWADDAE